MSIQHGSSYCFCSILAVPATFISLFFSCFASSLLTLFMLWVVIHNDMIWHLRQTIWHVSKMIWFFVTTLIHKKCHIMTKMLQLCDKKVNLQGTDFLYFQKKCSYHSDPNWQILQSKSSLINFQLQSATNDIWFWS